MYKIKIKGDLYSKFAMHVPVIRRWRLVWERREFGTRLDRIDETIPLPFDAWAMIPEGGVTVDLPAGFKIVVERVVGSATEHKLGIGVYHGDLLIPGTYNVVAIPTLSGSKILGWKTELWKGVRLDVEAVLVYG